MNSYEFLKHAVSRPDWEDLLHKAGYGEAVKRLLEEFHPEQVPLVVSYVADAYDPWSPLAQNTRNRLQTRAAIAARTFNGMFVDATGKLVDNMVNCKCETVNDFVRMYYRIVRADEFELVVSGEDYIAEALAIARKPLERYETVSIPNPKPRKDKRKGPDDDDEEEEADEDETDITHSVLMPEDRYLKMMQLKFQCFKNANEVGKITRQTRKDLMTRYSFSDENAKEAGVSLDFDNAAYSLTLKREKRNGTQED